VVAVGALVVAGCADDAAAPVRLDGFDGGGSNNGEPNNGNNGEVTCERAIEAEVCDGVDNDCDGEVDEDFPLESDVNNCGACGRGCTIDQGRAACRGGECAVAGCLAGWFDEDGVAANGCESEVCTPTAGGVEVCDGRDNDCDGELDEGFGVGSTAANCMGCGVACALDHAEATCGGGVCEVLRCLPGFANDDGRDNNGCEAVTCQPTSDGQEVCDGLDNDCDGTVDEGFDLTTVDRCGSCDNACAFDHATAACAAGACVVDMCDGGWVDLDLDRLEPDSNGCEYLCDPTRPAATDLACDGEDNDCDGEIDEDGGAGEPCALGERLTGIALCSQGRLRCVAEPSEGGVAELCGVIEGVLTAEGGPYDLVCPTLTVPATASLEVEPGAVLRTGLGLQAVRLVVAGALRSERASWTGVEVTVEGEATLLADQLIAVASSQSLLVVPSPATARLEATSVMLDGQGRQASGLVLGAGSFAAGGFVWDGGAMANLGVALSTHSGSVTLTDTIFTDNRRAIVVGADSEGIVLAGGTMALRNGQPGLGVDIEGQGRPVRLEGLTVAMRGTDAAVRLDPDGLPALSATGLTVVGSTPVVALAGDVDGGAMVPVVALGELDRFEVEREARIAAGSGLTLAEGVELKGQPDGRLTIDGALVAEVGDLLDLAMTVSASGQAALAGARIEASSSHRWSGCLVDAAAGASVELVGARVLGPLSGDGVCLRGVMGEAPVGAATLEGFGRALVVEEAGGGSISGVTFVDNVVGLAVNSAQMPQITSNTFRSGRAVQTVAIALSTGSQPGGEVVGNTFGLDNGDLAYHLDPDNLADDSGTVFGPNAWMGYRPTSFLMSGTLSSPRASLRSVSEVVDEVFLTVQVPAALEVAAGSALNVLPNGVQVFSLQGLSAGDGQTVLRVRGNLTMRGPGVLISFLPIVFEPGSGGVVTQADISSARTDFPLVSIEDAAPRIGGNGSVDGCSFSGSNRGDVIGFEIRSSSPMCTGADALCPFVARNGFFNLAIGMVVYAPANFAGVNEFDDSNPNGDTVPINIDRR